MEETSLYHICYIDKEETISYYPDKKLGQGSLGTIVYEGVFLQKKAAVKRISQDVATEYATREISILCNDDAPLKNVVTLYWATPADKPIDGNYYLVLELCAASLEDFVSKDYSGPMPDDREAMDHVCRGIQELHCRNIAHKDLKPENILISRPDNHGQVTMKIADFGLSRLMRDAKATNTITSNKGTKGWIASEVLATQKPDKVDFFSADIFSLGCVLHYFITRGDHPFGRDDVDRPYHIRKGRRTINTTSIDFSSASIIESMTEHDPEKRPSITQVTQHPFLWPPKRVIEFMGKTSDYLEPSKKQGASNEVLQLAAAIEVGAEHITGGNWFQRLSANVQQEVERFVKQHKILKREPNYYTKILNLLRTTRNLESHFETLPVDVQRELGNSKDERCKYWTETFPKLLMHVWEALKKCSIDQLSDFYQEEEVRSQTSSTTKSTLATTEPEKSTEENSTSTAEQVQTILETSHDHSNSRSTLTAQEIEALRQLSLQMERQRRQSRFRTWLPERMDRWMEGYDPAPGPDVVTQDIKEVGKNRVEIVACNPVVCGEAAVALKDGSVVLYQHGSAPKTIRPLSSMETTDIVWNESGTAIAIGNVGQETSLDFWSRRSLSIKTDNFNDTFGIISMKWTCFEGKDVIQFILGNKFYAKDTESGHVWEDSFPTIYLKCSKWNGSDRLAVWQFDGRQIDLYQVKLREERPLTRLASLESDVEEIWSVAWKQYESVSWIAATSEERLQVWKVLENDHSEPVISVESCDDYFGRGFKLEWMDSGPMPLMLAMVSRSQSLTTVRLRTCAYGWREEKAMNIPSMVIGMKYSTLEKALFLATYDDLWIIDGHLNLIRVGDRSGNISAFDLSCEDEGHFYALLGHENGHVTSIRMRITPPSNVLYFTSGASLIR